VGVTLDITARKLAEAAVERSLEQLGLIVDGALDAVVTMDADGMITGWNPQAERTFGWPRGEVLGRGMADVIVPEELREAHERGLRRFLETGEGPVIGTRIEVEAIDRFGRRFPVELSIVTLPMQDEVSFAGFVRDISERKEAEAEIQRALQLERAAADELRRASEMKDLFLQAVSHDLRTPLAAILGMSLTLQRAGHELTEEARTELVDRLSANARKLERLVSNLLDVDRLRRGVVEPVLEPVDLAALIHDVVEGSGLADRVTLEAEPIVAWVDGPKVERIIENLVANARRYTAMDTRVWVGARRDGEGVVLWVDDDGPGIPEEMRSRIFDAFEQGDGVPLRSPGVGIGLTLVQRFAELHGGRAWVEERDGGGSAFRVWLPDPGTA
jgi:PAS domain S-box-containing protein